MASARAWVGFRAGRLGQIGGSEVVDVLFRAFSVQIGPVLRCEQPELFESSPLLVELALLGDSAAEPVEVLGGLFQGAQSQKREKRGVLRALRRVDEVRDLILAQNEPLEPDLLESSEALAGARGGQRSLGRDLGPALVAILKQDLDCGSLLGRGVRVTDRFLELAPAVLVSEVPDLAARNEVLEGIGECGFSRPVRAVDDDAFAVRLERHPVGDAAKPGQRNGLNSHCRSKAPSG